MRISPMHDYAAPIAVSGFIAGTVMGLVLLLIAVSVFRKILYMRYALVLGACCCVVATAMTVTTLCGSPPHATLAILTAILTMGAVAVFVVGLCLNDHNCYGKRTKDALRIHQPIKVGE
jgi:hypothetical protein